MTKKEYIERYGEDVYRKALERQKEYYKENAERKKEYKKQYYKENVERIKEYQKEWRENNSEYLIQYRKDNSERLKEQMKEYKANTQIGRANNLVHAYKQIDIKKNRGECTLTSKWIVENIFNSKCVYCGESDWKKLGCDRIDNSLPHTEDNVVCSCWNCNRERKSMAFEEFVKLKRESK